MKLNDREVQALNILSCARAWVTSMDISVNVIPSYLVDEDTELSAKIDVTPILSEKVRRRRLIKGKGDIS